MAKKRYQLFLSGIHTGKTKGKHDYHIDISQRNKDKEFYIID